MVSQQSGRDAEPDFGPSVRSRRGWRVLTSQDALQNIRVTSIELEVVPLLICDIEPCHAKDRSQDHARRTGEIVEDFKSAFEPAEHGIEARPLGVDRGFIGVYRGNEIEREQILGQLDDVAPAWQLAGCRQEEIFLECLERLALVPDYL